MERAKYRKLTEAERLAILIEQLDRPIDGYTMLDVCDCDGPLMVRALRAELEKLGGEFMHGEYKFTQVDGDDPAWKGWGIRGSARYRKGWIIYDQSGVEVHRFPPDATAISFEAAAKQFDVHLKVEALES